GSFARAHTALLGSGRGPEPRTSLVPSEKCAGGWGSDDDDMRMITVSFVRAIEQFAGALALHFLPLCQQVVAIRKTRNQLIHIADDLSQFEVHLLKSFLHMLHGSRGHGHKHTALP